MGEVVIRGANVFAGLRREPAKRTPPRSATAGSARATRAGSTTTGYLFLRGRLKEIINRGGEKISPREVDEVLLEHPAMRSGRHVRGAASDARRGRRGRGRAASTATRRPTRASAHFAGKRLANFKVPRRFVVLDELPKGPTGKVQRIGLAERLGLAGSGIAATPPYLAPRTESEREIAALWADLLDVPQVGLHDDFFALGGESIAAAELMATLAERGSTLGELPPGTLLLAPTVERFAAFLDGSSLRFGASILVPLRAGDESLEPLFLVHTHEGHVLHYLPLALALQTPQPVWAFEAPTTADGDVPWRRLEDLAAAYVEEVRALQPEGPYWLGGGCLGGLIAFEMARQLEAAGAEVGLALLLSPSTGPRGSLTRARHRLVDRRERVALHRQRGDFGQWLWRRVRRRSRPSAHDARPRGRGRTSTPAENRFLEQMAALRDSYVPSRYGGTIAVIRAPGYGIPCSYWRRLAGRVRCENLPSTPTRVEHTRLLAELVDAALEAQRAEASSRARRRS